MSLTSSARVAGSEAAKSRAIVSACTRSASSGRSSLSGAKRSARRQFTQSFLVPGAVLAFTRRAKLGDDAIEVPVRVRRVVVGFDIDHVVRAVRAQGRPGRYTAGSPRLIQSIAHCRACSIAASRVGKCTVGGKNWLTSNAPSLQRAITTYGW
ncbi:hypothetical protein B0O95_10648 [Mycetohabitans endofungorum]|uniref:Uncharacterized protein n=1 Tax=Mycetohabitans endofungorum TaxID=417203 RepID=A0A2P5KAB4_9BURK|nr:hypothetical protein B0O95_10648 [Mycetohabitans endofungorum]